MWRRLIYHPEINYALRETLVLCLPVAVGLLFGNIKYGLLLSLVPACCDIAGLDTPHKHFFKRLFIGAVMFPACSLIVQMLLFYDVPLPVILTGLAMILGVTAEISMLQARLLPACLIAAIFTLSLVGAVPVWQTLLLYAAGTLWYGLFNWLWFRLWREQPLRETLSLLYRHLADYCEAKYSMLTRHVDPQTAIPPLLDHQQKAVDLITQCYQQLHMLSANKNAEYRRLQRIFQMALDVQEHLSVSLNQPEEIQKLVEESHAEEVIRWNARTIAAELREVADDILYHRYPRVFNMEKQTQALGDIALQHPENPVGQFCAWHFSRIARILQTHRPIYSRDLMADTERRQPLLRALKSYLSLKSPALRNAARLSVMLSVASLAGAALNLPKPFWILMTVLLVTQNSYGATRVRIYHRAAGTVIGLLIAGATLHFHVAQGYILIGMVLATLISYLTVRTNYTWGTVGFTITAVYTLQLLALNGDRFIAARLVDTLMGCLIAFGGTLWLWPQWQSGLLRQNAHDALEAERTAIRLLLNPAPEITAQAYQRIRVNQAQNTLFNSLNQAMQEPGFNSRYLNDMKMWVTHSQFIVEHINAMTILAREHYMLTEDLARSYLQASDAALARCQQRLGYEETKSSGKADAAASGQALPHGPLSPMEIHLHRILGHLSSMEAISSVAWRRRPRHAAWMRKKLSR